MSKEKPSFTRAYVRDLQPDPEKTRLVFDGALAGFGVRIEPSGVKAWVIEFRDPGAGRKGQKRRQTIGRVDKIELDVARKAAKKIFGEIAGGRDIHAEAVEAKRGDTFAAVAEDFLAHVKRNRKARTHQEYKKIIDGILEPAFGKKLLKAVSRGELRKLHERISDRAPFMANRALAVFSSIWSFAARDELVKFGDNPAKGQVRNREEGRERFLTADELTRLLDALDAAEGAGLSWKPSTEPQAKHAPKTRVSVFSPHVTGAIRLLLLTGARLSEILGLRFADVDVERGLAFLPDSKTGKKALPLNTAAIDEIERLRAVQENDFVVGGGAGGKPRADLRKPWAAVTSRLLKKSLAIGMAI